MSTQTRIKQPTKKQNVEEVEPIVGPTTEKLKEYTDALLDEIDDCLQENAEAFVAAYIQKGGEHHKAFPGENGRMPVCPRYRSIVQTAKNFDL